MTKSQTIEISGMRIRVLGAGQDTSEPPLILLHGGGTDSACLSWGGVIDPLAASRRVLAPDLPGYGDSERPDAHYSIEFYCTFLADLVDALGLGKFDLGGLSMGGSIALAYILSHSDRVRRLVLVDTYGIQPDFPPHWLSYLVVNIPLLTDLTYMAVRSKAIARGSLRQLVRTPGALTDTLVDEVMAESRKPRAGKAFNTFQKHEVLREGLRTDFMPRLGQITAPTLIIHGGADTLVPLKYAKEASWLIPNCRLEVLRGAGHWAQRDQPEAFVTLVDAFLDAP